MTQEIIFNIQVRKFNQKQKILYITVTLEGNIWVSQCKKGPKKWPHDVHMHVLLFLPYRNEYSNIVSFLYIINVKIVELQGTFKYWKLTSLKNCIFWWQKPVYHNLVMDIICQFSMSESTWIIFLDHIDHIRDDICDASKKIQSGTKDNTWNCIFWWQNPCVPQSCNGHNSASFQCQKVLE